MDWIALSLGSVALLILLALIRAERVPPSKAELSDRRHADRVIFGDEPPSH